MKLHIKEQDSRSAHSPSRTGGPPMLAMRRPEPAGRRPRAIRQAPLCGADSVRSRHLRAPNRRSEGAERSTPPHPLTFRAMLGKRHPAAPRSGRSAFSLLSVLALLALACFPVIAQADGAGAQYEPELPKVPVQKKPPKPEPKAHASNETSGGGVPSGAGGSGSSGGGSSSGGSSSGATQNPSTSGGSGNAQGSPGNGSPGSQGGGSVQQAKPVSSTVPTSESSSSPVVPILIAIAALAAISIGVVVIRQRRQRRGPGGTVAPKAS